MLAGEGKLDEASRSYRRAIQLAPNDVSAHHNLGVLLQVQGKPADAIAEYREAVRIDDRYLDAHYGLAVSFAEMGQFDQAVASAEKALALATAARNDRLAAQIRERLNAYRQRLVFRGK